MKRLLCLTAALVMLFAATPAQAVTEAQAITGERYYPEGSGAATAAYIFRYTCPQFEASGETAAAVNAYLAALVSDMASAVPETVIETVDGHDVGMPAYYTQLNYNVTANTEDYISVLFSSRQFLGNSETESWCAVVFAVSGVYAGQPVSLSQAIGMEQEDDAAAAGDSYAAELVYNLVWQIISEQRAALTKDYYQELTLGDLQNVFSPESDFYLDADGNFVFFIQSGEIASEVEGILAYPFSMAELLSAVKDNAQGEPAGGQG